MIIFQSANITHFNKEQETVMESAQAAGVFLENICGGNGTCGKCKVKVIIGECNPVTEAEKKYLTEEEISQGYRLACKLVPKMAFRTCEILVEEQSEETIAPKIEAMLEKEQLQKELREIEKAVGVENIRKYGGKVNKNVDSSLISHKEQWIDKRKYGIALDIGTTNIEMLLWDMESGTCLGRKISSNKQRSYGADVVSRIAYAVQSEEDFQKLCEVLQKQIRKMMSELLRKQLERINEKNQEAEEISQDWNEKIEKMVVVGNAAMMHFFAGEKVDTLAKAPYTSTYKKARILEGKIFDLPNARIYLAPNIEGFVGADTVGVMTYLSDKEKLDHSLMIDIGTNGEIALVKGNICYVASTAAGPAFEGASISCGMRGEAGAIRGMTIREKISLDVIGEIEPKVFVVPV